MNLNLTSGFTFMEVNSVRASNSKVTSCHFSSDGKLLASGGHDKKVSSKGRDEILCAFEMLVYNWFSFSSHSKK